MKDEKYRATHAYAARQDDELSLKPGDVVRITSKESDDWWIAENIDTGALGMVPSNFLEKVTDSTESKNGPILAKVLQDYEPQDPEELALWKDGIVTVLDQNVADGWWKGDLNGKTGVFPARHVKLVETMEENEPNAEQKPKSTFKLAAYGVKQGGIGSILAGGMGLRKKPGKQPSLDENQEATPSPSSPPEQATSQAKSQEPASQKKAMVIHDYQAENEDELQLMRGEYIIILEKMDNQGWWKGQNESGIVGVFPSNYVQVLEEQRPPPRRARPPTIKPEAAASSNANNSPTSPSLAKPPPVPVSTRPTTLLSNRTSSSTESSATAPPPRPVTSPPIPNRRPPSIATESKPGHKPRVPSIPLVSPDLPPKTMEEHHAPARPSRPVPPPAAPPRPASEQPERTSIDADAQKAPSTMAKPPKTFGVKGGPPPTPSLSRPTSQASSQQPTIPAVPPPRIESGHERKSSVDRPMSPPPAPRRSMPPPPPQAAPVPEHETADISPSVRALISEEIEKVRREFEGLLETERSERQQLEKELGEIKARMM
ncbi:hypothetical protein VTP01DRAFT_7447 [Rhizomucor pusillus]|uniref:uncharacterized protein n=1 Tax=Rhizomucor pusillus TaxID=4840 RepID=UPI0037435BC3